MKDLPAPVLRAARLYQRLLSLYPKNHRQEFGEWMAQVFRDVCLSAYHTDGQRGISQVWLRTIPDLTRTVMQEHNYEIKRWLMKKDRSANGIEPRSTMGLLLGAVLIAFGLLASVVIRQVGGSALIGTMVAVILTLAAAVVMEFSGDRSGVVLGAMSVMLAGYLLPLLWVPDAEAWLRENPVIGGIIILIASVYRTQSNKAWPIYAAAAIFAAAQILVSLIN